MISSAVLNTVELVEKETGLTALFLGEGFWQYCMQESILSVEFKPTQVEISESKQETLTNKLKEHGWSTHWTYDEDGDEFKLCITYELHEIRRELNKRARERKTEGEEP